MSDGKFNTGQQLEEIGWRQGSIVKAEDIIQLLEKSSKDFCDKCILIIASQSCDITNFNVEDDPILELSIGRVVKEQNGNCTFNKNARILHTELKCKSKNSTVSEDIFVELKACEKIQVDKSKFLSISPDRKRILANEQLKGYVSWLAARYSRPALPTAFNDRISMVDPKNKRKNKAKSANDLLLGIYVEIIPDKEIPDGETYMVNLLGLVSANFSGDIKKVEAAIDGYAEILTKAGMDVKTAISGEDKVSIADINRFKRFYYDDLSFRNGSVLPPETKF